MTDDDQNSPEPTDEPDGQDSPEPDQRPTPEQLAAMRKAMQSAQFKGLARFAQGANAMSGISDAYNKAIAETMRPAAEVIKQWQDQQKTLTSDVFKAFALTQTNLDNVATQLFKNGDFKGISEGLAAQHLQLRKSIAPILKNFRAAFYPPNLREVEGLTLELVEEVVMVDGIALYGVPRIAVAQALLRAEGATERREVLVSRWQEIAADCRVSLEASANADLEDFVLTARAALDALDAGHIQAAQALAAALLDALLRSRVGDYRKLLPNRDGERPKAYEELNARQFIALGPILQAYQRFAPGTDPVPAVFNRHACAHTVSPLQYERHNAIQGVLLVCSLLYFLDEWAASAAA